KFTISIVSKRFRRFRLVSPFQNMGLYSIMGETTIAILKT
ncbi:MAG: hypothetical protein ACI9XB_001825, partial [Gammaproteobacteria bacterium]